MRSRNCSPPRFVLQRALHRSLHRSALLLAGLMLAMLLAPRLAEAQPDSEGDETVQVDAEAQAPDVDELARELYLRGERHYAEGEYDDAVDAFREAFELSERPQLQFNLANAYERLGNYELAISSLRAYAPHAPEYDHDTIARRIRSLESRLEADTAAATGSDGSRESPPLSTDLEESGGAPAGAVVILATGIAVLAVATVFGVLSLDAGSELEAACPTGLCSNAVEETYDRQRSFALVADLGFVVGGIATLAGATWLLTALGE